MLARAPPLSTQARRSRAGLAFSGAPLAARGHGPCQDAFGRRPLRRVRQWRLPLAPAGAGHLTGAADAAPGPWPIVGVHNTVDLREPGACAARPAGSRAEWPRRMDGLHGTRRGRRPAWHPARPAAPAPAALRLAGRAPAAGCWPALRDPNRSACLLHSLSRDARGLARRLADPDAHLFQRVLLGLRGTGRT
jgi:hypothetical protein